MPYRCPEVQLNHASPRTTRRLHVRLSTSSLKVYWYIRLVYGASGRPVATLLYSRRCPSVVNFRLVRSLCENSGFIQLQEEPFTSCLNHRYEHGRVCIKSRRYVVRSAVALQSYYWHTPQQSLSVLSDLIFLHSMTRAAAAAASNTPVGAAYQAPPAAQPKAKHKAAKR